MSQEANIATAKKMGEAINKGNFEEFNNIFAPDVVDHDPAPDQGKGPQGFIGFFTEFRSAFPDLKISVDHMVADDDNVAIAYTIQGTQQGPFEGIPATGKKIKVRGMQIAKFNANAQIKERWGSSDQMGIMQQIGAITPSKHMDDPPVISGAVLS
ncbi:MAG: ester cyclase [Janthinobacterium lividum]